MNKVSNQLKILLIGPMPEPVTGVSFANEILVDFFRENSISVQVVNTHVGGGVSQKHGSLSYSKVFSFLSTYLAIYKIVFSDVLYLTPGQTFWGVFKYTPFMLIAKLLGKPYVFHLHGNYLGKEFAQLSGVKKRIFKYLVSSSAAGIALSESLRENFRELLPENKIYTVVNFVDDNFRLNACQNKSGSELNCLFLSNLMEEKGVLDFLQALKILKQKNVSFSCQIAGNFEEETKKQVNNLLQELKPEVKYLGVIRGEKKINAFRESNVFVLPTYYPMEGQPIAILEAMAAGNIIVTTKHAGIPDVVNEKNAIFVKEKAPEELASKLEYINSNKNLFDQFYTENTKKASLEFTEEQFCLAIWQILQQVK